MVPAHLNELSPEDVRGMFPGFAYQLGNLLASANATLQAGIAEATIAAIRTVGATPTAAASGEITARSA